MKEVAYVSSRNHSLRQLVRRLPLRWRETFVAPTLLPVCCICGLIRDETGLRPLVSSAGSRSGRIARHMACIRPIALSRTPTARHVSRRSRIRCGNTSGKSERRHDPARRLSEHRLLSPRPDRGISSDTRPGQGPPNKASAPPGESCLRCGGLLVRSYTLSLESDHTGRSMDALALCQLRRLRG